jgi:hypothetical protein
MMGGFPKLIFFGVTLPATFGSAVLRKNFMVARSRVTAQWLISGGLSAFAMEKPNNAEKQEKQQDEGDLLTSDFSHWARLAGLSHEEEF